MKICSTCGETKDLSLFEADTRYKSGYRSQCILCNSRGKIESTLRLNLARRYGIALEDYYALVASQNGVCKICGLPETRITRPKAKVPRGYAPRLAVDHNHKTGEIRGLLCHKCNVGLGNFQDSPELLLRAAAYLKEYVND